MKKRPKFGPKKQKKIISEFAYCVVPLLGFFKHLILHFRKINRACTEIKIFLVWGGGR
jgi:hypothetical protein